MITCNWIWLQLIYFLITAKTEYRNTPGGDHLINHTSLFCITFQKGWTAGMRIWIILLDPDHFAASRSFCRTRTMQYISSHSDSNLTHFKYRYITDFSETDLDSTTMLGWTSSGLNDRGKLNNTYEVGPGPWRCPLQARAGYRTLESWLLLKNPDPHQNLLGLPQWARGQLQAQQIYRHEACHLTQKNMWKPRH